MFGNLWVFRIFKLICSSEYTTLYYSKNNLNMKILLSSQRKRFRILVECIKKLIFQLIWLQLIGYFTQHLVERLSVEYFCIVMGVSNNSHHSALIGGYQTRSRYSLVVNRSTKPMCQLDL